MDNFEAVAGRLMVAHARLKAIQPNDLSDPRREERSKLMRDLRKAIEGVVALKFGELSAAAKSNAKQLDTATKDLQKTLSNMMTAVQVIKAIGAGLAAIVNLVGLINKTP